MDLDRQTAPESTHGFFGSPEKSTKNDWSPDYRRHSEEIRTKSLVNIRASVQHRSMLHTVSEEDAVGRQPQVGLQRKNRSTTVFHFPAHDGNNADSQDPDDDGRYHRLSRAAALAETEAKLNGALGNRMVKSGRPNSQQDMPHFPQPHQEEYIMDYHHNNGYEERRRSSRMSSGRYQESMYAPPAHYQDSQKPHNRRLSEPNARIYYRDTELYHEEQQQQQQRRSLNSYSHHQGQSNKYASLQPWSMSQHDESIGHDVNDSGYSRTKPNLTLDTSRMNQSNSNSRRSSRNDWRASTSSATPRSPQSNRSSFAWAPFTPTRYSFNGDESTLQQQQQQRRALFTAHFPFSAIIPLLRSHQLVSGLLRVNKRNRSDAYVFCEALNADIYICGSRDRNRALEGDVVAVRLVDVDKVLREKHEKEQAKVARNNGQPIMRKPDEEDEKEIMFGGEEDVDRVKPKYCGVVVAILERAQSQMFSGTLGLMRPSNKRPKENHAGASGEDEHTKDSPRIVWFKPTDKRVPLIAIPVEQAPPGFIENYSRFENKLFLGSIKRWPVTSLHPFGVLEDELGPADDIRIQFRAILADNNFSNERFSENVMRCLPTLPWSPTDESIASRLDLRGLRCITFEKEKLLDKAMSVRKMGDSTFEVGLHVSDFSAFVKPHSPLDKEARLRAVAVHLFESAPLWPEELLEHCTDFTAGAERFAFSVIWKMNQDGELLETWYGKTVIKSHGVLTIQQVQDVLDGNGLPAHLGLEDQEKPEWENDLHLLYSLAGNLLDNRVRSGAIMIKEALFDIEFGKDDMPERIALKPETAASVIPEEFSILANTGVAQKISSHFPDYALLQAQAPANERKLCELARYLGGLGYTIDPSSAGALQQSIDKIGNEAAKTVITALVLKTLSRPKFFCTGSFDINRYFHYALNIPLYTQFTSPARCYADLIVHRQLEGALSGDKRFYLESDTIQRVARQCNVKSQAADNAREQSHHLFLSRYLILSRQTTATHEAIVVGVQEQSFDVMVPELNLERRIHVINLPVKSCMHSPSDGVLHLFWMPGVATSDAVVEQKIMDDQEDDMEDDELVDDDHTLNPVDSLVSTTQQLSIQSPDTPAPFKRRPRSVSLRAIEGEDPWATQQECTVLNECRQVIRPFDYIRVVIESNADRSPPLIRVLAANPFV